MKVLVLVILLVSVCSLEGALVKRETEPVPPQISDIVQKIQEYAQSAHTYLANKGTELAQQEKFEELKAQAQTYLQALRDRMDPVATQVREGMNQVFTSLVDAARTLAQKSAEAS